MSSKTAPFERRDPAILFAALGDPTRLALLTALAERSPRALGELAEGAPISRQAIAKHLRVLAGAGLVAERRTGRETLFALSPTPLADALAWLDMLGRRWDDALHRLKNAVESERQ